MGEMHKIVKEIPKDQDYQGTKTYSFLRVKGGVTALCQKHTSEIPDKPILWLTAKTIELHDDGTCRKIS